MSASASVRVEKATSDLLIGPDWTMNIDICDSININQWEAKDVVKALKKRLQHKSPKVQLLALTLLETMVKNCGDYVHFQIAERNVLLEMSKIVKKKTDMHVRDKILVLLDSWQEAFGGPGGKHPQYYWAYEDLRRSGVTFPPRSADAAPIFTPPVTHPSPRSAQVGYGMPTQSSTRLDEAMASEIETLSLSGLESTRNVMELLAEMLQTVDPSDRLAVKDDLIVDLANQCRANQKKLMQMLTTTGDDELLGQGLELNDSLQNLLAKHDAMASGSPLPPQAKENSPHRTGVGASDIRSPESKDPSSKPVSASLTSVAAVTKVEAEEEEEDDFDQLARRHSRAHNLPSGSAANGTGGVAAPKDDTLSAAVPTSSNALTLPDPPAPVRTTQERDMIDLLSLTLSEMPTSSEAPHTPTAFDENMHQVNKPSFASQNYPENPGQVSYNSYVVPWANPQNPAQPQQQVQPQMQTQIHSPPQPQPQPQMQTQTPTQIQPQQQMLSQVQPQHQMQTLPQSQSQAQSQPYSQSQFRYPHFSSPYPPPPWAATPGYFSSQNHSSTSNMFSTPRASTVSLTSVQAARPLQHVNSFPSRGSNASTLNGDACINPNPGNTVPAVGPKPFVPSYRLFEDLNILRNHDGGVKVTGTSSGMSMLGTSGQGMVGGKK